MNKLIYQFIIACLIGCLSACYMHPRGQTQLAKPLHRLYIQTTDRYDILTRSLEQYLIMSDVKLVSSPAEATAVLMITHQSDTQTLLSVSSTQQTRQYSLISSVSFEVTDTRGGTLLSNQTLNDSRVITIQSNQILGSSNEKVFFYQQMHRALAYAIINRISSQEATAHLNKKNKP